MRDLEENGAEVVSVTEGTNALSRGIQLVVAEDYSRQLAERTRAGLMNGRRRLEINPDEAAVVREIAVQYLNKSVGLKTIAMRMRERGIASRRGMGWSFTGVRSLFINPLLTGLLRYNVRRMQLDRSTGRRLPRRKLAVEHMARQERVAAHPQRRTGSSDPRPAQQGREGAGRAYRPRDRAVHGARVLRVRFEVLPDQEREQEGSYSYYVCGRHLSDQDCPHSARVREDKLTTMVHTRFAYIFSRADEIIARAVEIATAATSGNRKEAERLKGEIGAVDAEQERMVELLMDRAIGDAANAAVSRKMAEAEERRAMLQNALDGFRDDANDTTDGLAMIVRATLSGRGRIWLTWPPPSSSTGSLSSSSAGWSCLRTRPSPKENALSEC